MFKEDEKITPHHGIKVRSRETSTQRTKCPKRGRLDLSRFLIRLLIFS